MTFNPFGGLVGSGISALAPAAGSAALALGALSLGLLALTVLLIVLARRGV